MKMPNENCKKVCATGLLAFLTLGAPVHMSAKNLIPAFDSICGARQSGAIVPGEVIQIEAAYVTDGVHASFMTSGACGRESVLNVENLPSTNTNSARTFFEALEKKCAANGDVYLCNARTKVIAVIRIVSRSADSRLGAEILVVEDVAD